MDSHLPLTCTVAFRVFPQSPPAVTFLLAGLTETVVVLLRSAVSMGTVMLMSMVARIQVPTVQLPCERERERERLAWNKTAQF